MANFTNSTEEVDDQTLMNCIQNYRVIYDKGSGDYKDQRKKKNAWTEVSSQLGIEILAAQTRYKSIRTKFSKYIKQMRGRSGSGRGDLPPIREDLEHLRWLLVHIKHRGSTTNLTTINNKDILADEEGEREGDQEDMEEVISGDEEDTGNDGLEINHDLFMNSKPLQEDDHSIDSDKGELGSVFVETPKTSKLGVEEPGPSTSGSSSGKRGGKLPLSKQSRKRAWAKENSKEAKKSLNAEMDMEFIKTMTSITQAIKNSDDASIKQDGANDEDKYFCLSLVGQLKSLEPRFKSMAKLQILKVFNDIEWMSVNRPTQIHGGSMPFGFSGSANSFQQSLNSHDFHRTNSSFLHQINYEAPTADMPGSYQERPPST